MALIATLATQNFCIRGSFFPTSYSVAISSFPEFLILLYLRLKRDLICKRDFRIHKYHKYNYPILLILIIASIPFSIKSIANDIERRNTIAQLLADWGLIAILNKDVAENKAPLSQIKVLSFKEKNEWDLQAKYNIGKKAEDEGTEV